jgi:hypothetical protein
MKMQWKYVRYNSFTPVMRYDHHLLNFNCGSFIQNNVTVGPAVALHLCSSNQKTTVSKEETTNDP